MSKELKKWGVILDTIGITNNRESMAKYCERHSTIESKENKDHITGDVSNFPGTLPISMKILSLLDLEGKDIILTDKVETKEVYVSFRCFEGEDQSSMMNRLDNTVYKECARIINEDIKDKSYFLLDMLMEDMSIEVEGTMAPKIHVKMRYSAE